ncbi:hypothetical protein RMATCC62417_14534 [Rhizopus microsporus]|nr:hypothetical protein RMATCC62417_14534 [Rhizopus microsporus]
MYDMNNNAVRPTTADGYYKEPYYPESTERYARYNTSPPMSCCDRVCCGCCTCCPRWCRWISCILFILIIALAIVIGVLASQFKVPKVDFTGIQGTPQFNINNAVLNVNASLGFTVNNPNIESITFTSLDAEIYYHGYGNTSIGQGTIKDLHISSNGYTNFVFPFTLKVDITNPQDYPISEEDNLPKALLPVGNKPIISYTLEWLEKAGIHEAIVVANAQQKLSAYLRGYTGNVHCTVATVDEDIGTAAALRTIKDKIDDLREIERHPKYKTQKCRTFHKTGACPYGSRCTFRHFSLPGDDAKIKEENDKMGSVTGTSATTTTLSTTVFRGTESSKREPMVFPSAFTENLKMFQPNQWYNDASFPFATTATATATTIPPALGDQPLKRNYAPFVDYEDSLLPSNAESLLPHQLLFDLDSPDVEEQMKHCPIRNYVSQIPSYQHTTINTTNTNDTLCKSFFRPWLI